MVADSDGRRGRAADYVATLERLGSGQLPALPGAAGWSEGALRLNPGGQ
jgi:hypothetical protein